MVSINGRRHTRKKRKELKRGRGSRGERKDGL